jgi:monofunctional biosynthetic peptidoglycan transglycosylase
MASKSCIDRGLSHRACDADKPLISVRHVRRLRKVLVWTLVLLLVVPPAWVLLYRVVPPPGTPLMAIRALEGHGVERFRVPLDAIGVSMREAVVAAEDNRFCSHNGFDVTALREAIGEWRDGGRLRGASTISMQTSKNLFLWPGRDWLRKGLEAYMTVWLELLLPKRRILELYLNNVEFGPGVYGVQAAARYHFAREPDALTARQAALLAAVLPNPLERSAGQPSAFVQRQAERIQTRMRQLGPMLDCVR